MAEWDANQEPDSGWNSRRHYYEAGSQTWKPKRTPEGLILVHLANIAATQNFILIDKSDTTNFPHASSDGFIRLTNLRMTMVPDGTYLGEALVGTLQDVAADVGTFKAFACFPFERKSSLLNITMALDPPLTVNGNVMYGTETLVDNAAFGSNDLLWAIPDQAAAYSTPCGNGDMVCMITRTAGAIDVSFTFGYYVE